ncbi:MAG: transcriptional regulator HexR [Sterolibacterium sp.]|jgi:RpiR family carbohydrate utilization transcriptional regulator
MLTRIRDIRGELRKSERSVADFVLAQPDTVITLSIADLAATIGVSQPTVARFCQALGHSGYRDFKLRLAQSLASGIPFVHRDVNLHDSIGEIGGKVFDSSIAALIHTRNRIDAAALGRAVDILSRAARIEFYGQGNSGIVAQDGQHKFFRLNVHTVAYSDPHVHGMAATLLHAGDAVVAISGSGRSLDILRSVALARAGGAAVVAITAAGSPLAGDCDVALCVDVAEDLDVYTPMSSRLAQLAMLDVLAVGVALTRGPEFVAQLQKTKKSLQDKRVPGSA